MKPELKYGLIAGVGVSLWNLTEFLLGFHTTHFEIGERSGYFSNLIPLTTLFLLLKGKRDDAYDGRLTLGQGISSGLFASFVSALVVYSFMVSYNQFINPGWLDHALEWKVAQMRAQGRPETAIREQITFYRNANGPVGLVATILVGTTLMGAIFALGLTLLLRLRPDRHPAPATRRGKSS